MSLKQFLKGNEPFASVARSPAISSVTSIVSISTCSQLRILIFLSLSLSAHPFLRRLTMHNFLFFFKAIFGFIFILEDVEVGRCINVIIADYRPTFVG